MSELVSQSLFWLLSAVAIVGALFVLLERDVMRMALGLGAFLLAIAGFFAYYGFGFLALAELFVYVGGVLVLILFAIMLVHRGPGGAPTLESRFDPLYVIASLTVSAMLFLMLRPVVAVSGSTPSVGGPAELATLLLGPMLPQFEAVGALLLVALVAVVFVMGGERR
ncbi:MAG: NADH-quinone oxidoreductase subunit J [Coriobacteriia bacterium]|nr:NADH-quinone oxidoreductase subunit J [Coriobacteriia bacterium]